MEKETEIESLDEGIIDLESARLCQKGMREREREREVLKEKKGIKEAEKEVVEKRKTN